MKFKVAVLESNQNRMVSDTISSTVFPSFYDPFTLPCGAFGIIMKIERVVVADAVDVFDSAGDSDDQP